MGLAKTEIDLIILGMLMNGAPLHGYMIKQAIEDSYGRRYFKLSNSALYPRLGELESNGCIEGKKEPQANVPDRKVYRITEAGRLRLKELVTTPIKPSASPGAYDYDYKVHAVHFSLITQEERRQLTMPLYENARGELKEALDKREKYGQYMDKYSLAVLDGGIEELKAKAGFYKRIMEME